MNFRSALILVAGTAGLVLGTWVGGASDTNGVSSTARPSLRTRSSAEGWGAVRLHNDYPAPYLWGRAFITSMGMPASKSNHLFQVLDGRDGTILAGPSALTRDGIFDLGVVCVPRTNPGDMVPLVLRVWEGHHWGYNEAMIRGQALLYVPLGFQDPATDLSMSQFIGIDVFPWWGLLFRDGQPPEPSRDIKIRAKGDGTNEISALCPENWLYDYFLYGSRDMNHWTFVGTFRNTGELNGDRVARLTIPQPDSGPMFYLVIP